MTDMTWSQEPSIAALIDLGRPSGPVRSTVLSTVSASSATTCSPYGCRIGRMLKFTIMARVLLHLETKKPLLRANRAAGAAIANKKTHRHLRCAEGLT